MQLEQLFLTPKLLKHSQIFYSRFMLYTNYYSVIIHHVLYVLQEQAVVDEKNCDNETAEDAEHDPHYDPIISLPEVVVPTLEEDETVMLCL